MSDCLFCKIIKGEIPCDKIYEDENCLAFLDIRPNNPGHTLLIHKEHHENLFEMPDECLSQIAPVLKKIAVAVKQGVNADGINLAMNNGPIAGQVILHAHFHIIPRHKNDGLKLWAGKEYKEGEKEIVAERIRKSLGK